jgi:predicted ribosomally synthesized peptide with SipW-like signal peptide
MKRIIISLSVIGAVALLGIGATVSLFNDTETSAGNIFTAGSIDLKVDHTAQTYNGVDCKTCSVTVQSDTSNTVTGTVGGSDGPNLPHSAVAAWTHSAWTASIPGATWIWTTNPTTQYDATNDVIYTFQKKFTWMGPINGATLAMAVGSDNSYEVWLNGTKVAFDTNENNFATADVISSASLTPYIIQGENTLEIKVKNWKPNGWEGTPYTNPAGLLYKFTINGNCGDAYFQNHCELWQSTDLNGSQQFFNFDDIKPGDYGTNVISLRVSSNDAFACLLTGNIDDKDNTLTEPEVSLSDSSPLGELSQFIRVFAWNDSDNDGLYEGEAQLLAPNTPIADLDLLNLSLTGGGPTAYVGLAWCAGTQSVVGNTISCNGATMGDIAQSDSFTADLTAYAVQQRNNLGFTCSSVQLPQN